MRTIKAIRLHDFGGPENLVLEEIEAPAPGPGQVLIEVAASSVNPIDWKIRAGHARALVKSMPAILGGDVAGTVSAVGQGVSAFKAGDEVYAMTGLTGAYAQAVAIDADKVALKPKTAGFIQAGVIPLAALTAWQALFDLGGLTAGERVLIHAGAGGVGGYAIQLARHTGAYVITTASGPNADYVRGLGADEVIDHRTTAFETRVGDIDLVIDLIGGETLDRSWGVLKRGGRLVSASGAIDEAKVAEIGGKGCRIAVQANGGQLARIARLYDDGALKVTIAQTYPLADVGAAHTSIQGGRTRGKIALLVAPGAS